MVPLMLGKELELQPESQILLSTWIAKLAMVYEHTGKHPEFFSQLDRQHLMQTLEPPEDAQVWLASYVGPRALVLSQHFITKPSLLSELEDCLVINTGAVDRLAFQLVARRWKEPRPSELELERFFSTSTSSAISASWALATVRLWPVTMPTCFWPPRTDLDLDAFRRLADRWGGESIF